MAWVGSPAQSARVPEKTWQEQSRVKWRPYVVFAVKVYLKISPFVTVLGQDHKLIVEDSNSLL